MKTLLLIIFGILTIFLISTLFLTEPAYALCIPSFDWPDRPCYGCRGCDPGLQQEKRDWEPYYDFKGTEWMNAKKQQLKNIMQNNSLDLWYQQTDGDANYNAHRYYFLQGEVPDRYGYNFEETLEFENAWNAVENNSKYAPILLWNYHDVILEGTIIETDLAQMMSGEDVPLHTIKVNKYFKGEKNAAIITAVDNFDDLEINSFENGLFYLKKIENQNFYSVTIASVPTFGICDARDLIEISPVLPNEKHPISTPVGHQFIDQCVPYYFEIDPDDLPFFYESPLKQIKNGVPIDEIQCRETLVLLTKNNGFPVCVKEQTALKLIERNLIITSKVERDIMLSAGYKLYPGGWIHQEDQKNILLPEPTSLSVTDHNLINAKKLLETAYYENIHLGPLKINDVIVGFGIEDNTLVMDVKYRYSTSSEMDIVKKKIRDIVGAEIQIEYIPFKPSLGVIEMTMPYHWNEYLHKNNMDFEPANTSYGNNDGGIGDGTILCSPLVTSNGTEFYIASTVDVEPFVITETFIDQEKPDFCRKTWKTDVILEEPSRIISLWLEIGQGRITLE